MGLYNILHGVNPFAPLFREVLNLDGSDGKYPTGRFRDIWVDGDGLKITLFTRNGGSNRECYAGGAFQGDCPKDLPDTREDFNDPMKHNVQCMVRIIYQLRSHPNYIRDWDDDFDRTYAYFEFSIPKEWTEVVKELAKNPKAINMESLKEKTHKVINSICNMTPEQIKDKYPEVWKLSEVLGSMGAT